MYIQMEYIQRGKDTKRMESPLTEVIFLVRMLIGIYVLQSSTAISDDSAKNGGSSITKTRVRYRACLQRWLPYFIFRSNFANSRIG